MASNFGAERPSPLPASAAPAKARRTHSPMRSLMRSTAARCTAEGAGRREVPRERHGMPNAYQFSVATA
eukprot:10224557-Lingulodinium_polyedra.AAC.1